MLAAHPLGFFPFINPDSSNLLGEPSHIFSVIHFMLISAIVIFLLLAAKNPDSSRQRCLSLVLGHSKCVVIIVTQKIFTCSCILTNAPYKEHLD